MESHKSLPLWVLERTAGMAGKTCGSGRRLAAAWEDLRQRGDRTGTVFPGLSVNKPRLGMERILETDSIFVPSKQQNQST